MYSFYTKKLWMPPCNIVKLLLIMRLTTIILITGIMQVSASSFAQKITLSERNSSLVKIFDKIREQSGVDFVVSMGMLKDSKPVSIQVQGHELQDVLKQIFKNQDLEYTINDKFVVVKRKSASFLDRLVNTFSIIDIRGKVIGENDEVLAGASIKISGTNRVFRSDAGGIFYLQNVDENAVLEISYVGYKTKNIKASKDVGVIKLEMVKAELLEVTVNAGYYAVKESERTGNIAKITSKEIEKQPVSDVLATMQGRMAGVDIVQTTGVPGGGFNIKIRGQNSIRKDGNTPLYIIDGMPYPTQRLDNLTYSIFLNGPNPLNGINPADIESIEVLKDADATAIYGSRGANGVVLITTKKGKVGKSEFSVNAYSGVGKVTRTLKLMNTQQYLEMRNEAFANGGLTTASPEYETAYDINGTWDKNRYTDWQKEMIGGLSRNSSIQGGISGGSKNTQILLSGTYSKETTVFPGDFGYNKGSAHLSLNHSSNDEKFSAIFSGSYSVGKNNQPYADLTYKGLTLPPNAPALYKDNGELNWEPGFDNPMAELQVVYLSKNNTLTTSGTIAYKVFPGLELKTALGFVDTRLLESKTSPHTIFNPSYGYTSSSSSYSLNNGVNQSWSIEPQISWVQKIGKGELNALVGTTFQEVMSSTVYNSATGFTTNSLITSLGAAKSLFGYTNNIQYRYNAFFGRINFKLDEKYIVNITARRDGSSRFGPGKRFGNFGALGVAWLFGKERFITESLPFLSFGKLRSSYGTSGSDQIGDYQFFDTYSSARSNYQGVIGLSPTRLFNPDFSWESNKKLELAVDLGFLSDKIFFTAAYFRNRSSSQLVGTPLPGTTGFTSLQANLNATVQNTGLELELRTINIQSSKFKWSTSLNLTAPRNKLVSFPGFEGSVYAYDFVLGESLSIRKLYNYLGINPETGIYQFEDYNGDGALNYEYDKQKLIDLASSYFGGLSNNITYGNFELDFVFQAVKQYGLNTNATWGNIAGQIGAQPTDILNRWQKSGDNKSFQRYTAGYDEAYDAFWRYSGSTAAFTDASFIRLKTLSLAYSLKKSWMKGANCRLSLQAQNLFTITGYRGPDPENQLTYVLPPLSVITAGIKLTY
jgi:TonB-linked SusC/RagA family outer membrane protein